MQELSNKQETMRVKAGVRSWVSRLIIHRFQKILDGFQDGRLELIWPDGTRTRHGSGSQAVSVALHGYEPVHRLIFSGQIGFAESYLQGQWSTSDIHGLFALILRNEHRFESRISGGVFARLRSALAHAFNRNTLAGSKKNIAFHYDLGNDFYSLWLDPSMTYSSGIYEHGDETLEQAQQNKIGRIVELLAPAEGSQLLEIGCGWGSLAQALAVQRGCNVRAISLSKAQLAYARRTNSNQTRHRPDLVDFQFADYRDIRGSFDHVVSIEMFEAVGMAFWDSYFRQLSGLLKTGGTALLQVITIAEDRFSAYRRNPDFIQQYIFPGGMLPTRTQVEQLIARHGFKLTHTDWIGRSYAATLRSWRENFEARLPMVRELGYDDRFIRMWRYYLAYCESGFEQNRTDVGIFLMTRR